MAPKAIDARKHFDRSACPRHRGPAPPEPALQVRRAEQRIRRLDGLESRGAERDDMTDVEATTLGNDR